MNTSKVSFGYPGGKARLTKWLMSYFPKNGNRYIEPFCGNANVFFVAKQELFFKKWHINDKYSYDFLQALLKVMPQDLPDIVNKESFEKWKQDGTPVSTVIGPRITFLSKGYKHGFSGDRGSHTGYRGEKYRNIVQKAKELLNNTQITNLDYKLLAYNAYDSNDFVYFDPPYHETESIYPNIDHEELIAMLKKAKYRWALSGYNTNLYKNKMYNYLKATKERNAEMAGMNKKKYQVRIEYLWYNY
jgi:DNA adenine methylase